MKSNFINFLFLGLLMSASVGHADIVCENGSFEQMGDGYFSMTISRDGISFAPYESSVFVPANDIQLTATSYSVIDKKIQMSGEGEVWTVTVDALVTFEALSMAAPFFPVNVALSLDRGAFRAYELNCKKSQ